MKLTGARLALALYSATCALPAIAGLSLPCVREVCLGEGPERLRSIDWEPVQSRHTGRRVLTASQQEQLHATYKGRYGDDIAVPLQKGQFDRDVLNALGRIDAACRQHDLVGKYRSDGGHPTRVTLRLLPDGKGKQQWRVISITRAFPEARDRRAQQATREALTARYRQYDTHNQPPRPGAGGYHYMWIGHPVMMLTLGLPDHRLIDDQLAEHPGCERRNPISID